MRSRLIKTLAMVVVLIGVGLMAAQQPGAPPGDFYAPDSAHPKKQKKQKAPPEKLKLEEMLTEALKNNPDIRVAAAKMAEAEAELHRTRLQVTQKVVTLYYAIEAQRNVVEYAEKRDKRLQNAGAATPVAVIDEQRQTLALAKGKLAELEAQLPVLLGKAPEADYHQTIQQAKLTRQEAVRSALGTRRAMIFDAEQERTHLAMGPRAECLRKALQTPVKVKYLSVKLSDVFKDLEKKAPGLSLRGTSQVSQWAVTDIQFEEALPVSAVLQALADDQGLRFIIREYGILALRGDVPPGGLTVEDFLRHKPADESRPQSRGGKNPPAENVEGLVKNVDASGLMTLTIGSDAGLAKGHTLEVFRLNPSAPSQSKYLGTVRILEAEAHQAVAQAIGGLSSPPQRGDRVASRILGQ